MKKFIVTTTINPPTIATQKYASFKDWTLIVVGDKKTPHETYKDLNCIYMSPDYMEKKYKDLSDLIGWNTFDVRNLGYIEAYQMGADVIASVDDDNIPYDDWGTDLYVNQEIVCDLYDTTWHDVFDPLSVTARNEIWHRGYPIEYVPTRHNVEYKGKTKRKVLVQADLWDGNPDIDAIARMAFNPSVKYSDITSPYCSHRLSPFNTQNTFFSRNAFPHFCAIPGTGRMNDIWGAYIFEYYNPSSVIYNRASVFQDRNPHVLTKDLEDEMIGYKNTFNLIKDIQNYHRYLPEKSYEFYKLYKTYFN
jgi:hypothetical protein